MQTLKIVLTVLNDCCPLPRHMGKIHLLLNKCEPASKMC
jgi:hypothetical protein